MSSSYSQLEERVLKVLRELPKDFKITTPDLIIRVYGDAAPLNARQALVATMRSLIRKVESRSELFAIRQEERKAPQPLVFWMEKKAKVRS